jgi:putative phosphoesterase
MRRIAIISDIHANLPALKAVLADITDFKADQIYCLGDLTDAAPWHNEVIELIQSLSIPTIMGNHDERIAFDLPVYPLSKHTPEEQSARLTTINFTKATISEENKQYLSKLPASIRITTGAVRVLLVHGSAESNEEYLYASHEEQPLRLMLEKHKADIMICGHTHLSYIRRMAGNEPDNEKMIINAGSVGRTKEGDGKATYIQLLLHPAAQQVNTDDVQVTIRKISYDVEETMSAIINSPVPDFYAAFLKV